MENIREQSLNAIQQIVDSYMKKQIEVSPRGHYDSAPLLLEDTPDLEKLFVDPPAQCR